MSCHSTRFVRSAMFRCVQVLKTATTGPFGPVARVDEQLMSTGTSVRRGYTGALETASDRNRWDLRLQ